MADSALMFRPALELAALVRSGELSARDLVAASLERIDALNPELNAFVDVFHDEALAAAGAVHAGDERPFAGVPVAVKNNRAVAGPRLTYGADFMGDWEPPYDHNVVRRLRAAGFIVVGTTTLPEWGILPWTYTKRFGATRIPAACCGLVGLKPQRGRTSFAPEIGQSFLAVDGVLTRTVPDTAAALDAISGAEVGDAGWAPPPPEPFAAAAERAPERLRVAVTTFPPLVMLRVAQARLISGREPTAERMEPLSWALWQLVGRMSALDAHLASAQLEIYARGLLGWMDRYDVIVTPSLAE